MELDPKLSTADLAKARLKKAKVWRLLDEAKATIADSKAPPEKIQQAQDQLEIANKLGLDDEQQAVYSQLRERSLQGSSGVSIASGAGHHESIGKDGAPMVLIPAGEFTMGDDQGEKDERPARRVYLDAFSIDKFEVTVALYAKFLEATGLEAPPQWNIINQFQHQKRPVVMVDWADAATYCKWAGKRLPTEAEWEKAARGTDGRTFPWGNDPPTRLHANFGKFNANNEVDYGWNSHAALNPVGLLEDGKSPYGIYDMAGNVSEWTSDWYDKNAYQNSPARNPKGAASGEDKVLRGGSWLVNPQALRSAHRDNDLKPTNRFSDNGFRCAKTP